MKKISIPTAEEEDSKPSRWKTAVRKADKFMLDARRRNRPCGNWSPEAHDKVLATMAKNLSSQNTGEWDWLAYAIGKLEGPRKAAMRIGISYTVIYGWLENGLASAKFMHVAKLSEEADVPLEYLVRRLGPYEEPGAAAKAAGLEKS